MSRLFGGKERPLPSYRNGSVIQRLMDDHGVDRGTATLWFDEMLVFLDLCAGSKKTLSPPKEVDAAWHAFILHTRDYEAYCKERFGRVIHHQPTAAADPSAYLRAYESRRAYRWHDPNPIVWPVPIGGTGDGGQGPTISEGPGAGMAAAGEIVDRAADSVADAVEDSGGGDAGGGDSGGGDSGGSSGGDSGGSSCGSSCGGGGD
jgi:hypothetical protein